VDNRSSVRVWHCQTVKTSQPSERKSALFRLSRARFPISFGPQNSNLDLGGRPIGHRWVCQKQPLTKITLPRAGKTMSGFPGRSRLCNRNRYPNEWSRRRTISSGAVSLPRIRLISALRLFGVLLSVMLQRADHGVWITVNGRRSGGMGDVGKVSGELIPGMDGEMFTATLRGAVVLGGLTQDGRANPGLASWGYLHSDPPGPKGQRQERPQIPRLRSAHDDSHCFALGDGLWVRALGELAIEISCSSPRCAALSHPSAS